MEQTEKAIGKVKTLCFSWRRHSKLQNLSTILIRFSCHKAYASDVLNVNTMNLKPGGKQAVMHDTFRCIMSPNVSELDRHGGQHCTL